MLYKENYWAFSRSPTLRGWIPGTGVLHIDTDTDITVLALEMVERNIRWKMNQYSGLLCSLQGNNMCSLEANDLKCLWWRISSWDVSVYLSFLYHFFFLFKQVTRHGSLETEQKKGSCLKWIVLPVEEMMTGLLRGEEKEIVDSRFL